MRRQHLGAVRRLAQGDKCKVRGWFFLKILHHIPENRELPTARTLGWENPRRHFSIYGGAAGDFSLGGEFFRGFIGDFPGRSRNYFLALSDLCLAVRRSGQRAQKTRLAGRAVGVQALAARRWLALSLAAALCLVRLLGLVASGWRGSHQTRRLGRHIRLVRRAAPAAWP